MTKSNKTLLIAQLRDALFYWIFIPVAVILSGLFPAWLIAAGPPGSFEKELIFTDLAFHISCANQGSLNDVVITPSGSAKPIIIKDADGNVYGAEIADLNGDGAPEIYIFMSSAGSGSYGSLIAYGSGHGSTLIPIPLPALEKNKDYARGYMGHDQFSLADQHLIRRFPIYHSGDSNAQPSGGIRQIEYKLIPKETGWQLQAVRGTTFAR